MPYPFDTATTNAIARLAQYNSNNYDATSNAKGLAQGGHRINFVPSLQDVGITANSIAAAAASASSSAATFAAGAPGQLGVGSVVQSVYTATTGGGQTSVTIPLSGSAPGVTQGALLLSASITPRTTTNKFRVRVSGTCFAYQQDVVSVLAFFLNEGTTAISTTVNYLEASRVHNVHTEFQVSVPRTTLNTIKMNIGVHDVDRTVYWGAGNLNEYHFGNTIPFSMVVEEIFAT